MRYYANLQQRQGRSVSRAFNLMIGLASLTVVLPIVYGLTAPSASGYVHYGCRQPSNSYVGVDRAGMTNYYGDLFLESMSAWNSKQDFITFNNSVFPAADVYGFSAEYQDSFLALTTFGCTGSTMVNTAVKMNKRKLGLAGRTTAQIKQVGIHELGHTLGLNHTNKTCSASVMDDSACIGTIRPYPYWDDINGVEDWGY